MVTHAPIIAIYLGCVFVFALGGLVVGLIIGRIRSAPSQAKLATYECGNETQGPTWRRLKTNYFTYALVFLLFDVEVIYLFPWALKAAALGRWILLEVLLFIAMLVVGLWYAYRKGALEWN